MNRNNPPHKIAIVAPWFGGELIGGAERLAWELAHALARAGASVDVLTTCSRSFHDDWGANYHRAGVTAIDGITVRRFKVDSRDRAAFGRANAVISTLPDCASENLRMSLADWGLKPTNVIAILYPPVPVRCSSQPITLKWDC